jgi:chemotaxis protein MotB
MIKLNTAFTAALAFFMLLLAGCVPMKKYDATRQELSSARYDSSLLANKVIDLQNAMAKSNADNQHKIDSLTGLLNDANNQIAQLNKTIDDQKHTIGDLNTDAANRSALLSKSKQDLINQQAKLEHLQELMDKQKKAIEDIRQKMTNALVGFNSNELSVAIKNGKVYVSLQENLLFPSGSAVVNPKGKEALGKLATVLNQNPDITVDIEGHTDSIPIHAKYQDNWDLSLARAASIVRILTVDYRVDPTRVIASGHSQYDPVQTNSTPEGRQLNRRTDIILSPRLDELYRLLQTPGV